MSDYSHEKVVRVLFPKEILDKCSTDDPHDCEGFLKDKLGELWDNAKTNCFKIGFGDKHHYIDWCYYSTYGEESGDWGNVRLLTKKELEVIKPYFDKIGFKYKDTDLRVVDYCYYNCCEPPDYYEIVNEDNDDSGLFLKN